MHQVTNLLEGRRRKPCGLFDFERMKRISLTQGKEALVDNADHNWLSQYRWCAHKSRHTFYAERGIRIHGKLHILHVHMHRLILGLVPSDGKESDHIDGNGLNNQRSNLRMCSDLENAQNRRALKGCSSEYKGVCWHKGNRKWYARIKLSRGSKSLGLFDSEIEAALSYNRAAKNYFGEYARLNDIERVQCGE